MMAAKGEAYGGCRWCVFVTCCRLSGALGAWLTSPGSSLVDLSVGSLGRRREARIEGFGSRFLAAVFVVVLARRPWRGLNVVFFVKA